jgi:hypothetical protein
LRLLCDPLVRWQMGKAGQRRVRHRFSLCRQAQELTAIMDALACGAIQGVPLGSARARQGHSIL